MEVKDGKATAPIEFKFKPKVKTGMLDQKSPAGAVLTSVTKPADAECEHCKEAAGAVVKKESAGAPVAAAAAK